MNENSEKVEVSDLLKEFAESIQYGKMSKSIDFSKIMNGFKFSGFDDLKIQRKDISGDILKATDLLNYTQDTEDSYYQSRISIKKLGKLSFKNDKKRGEDYLAQQAAKMAQVLSSSKEAFSLRVDCHSDTPEITDMQFVVSSSSLSESTLTAMVRSVYGRAETVKPYETKRWYAHVCYGSANVIFGKKDDLLKTREETAVQSWTSAVLRSLPDSRNYSAEIEFVPLLDEDNLSKLDKHIDDLNKCYNLLTYYAEIGWNTTLNAGVNIGSSASNAFMRQLYKVKDAFVGNDKLNFNTGNNYGLSTKEINQEIRSLLEELEYEIVRLRYARSSVAWAVRICISADKEATLDIITSAMAGMLEKANISLKWDTTPSTALIGSVKTLYPLMLFPTSEFPGFEFTENEDYSLISPGKPGVDIKLGSILWNGEKVSDFYLPAQALNRHAFICGMTGAGKTNTLFKIIEDINVPFLVIEPVKGEYRSLQSAYDSVKIWTMRTSDELTDSIGILQINPFWFPKAASLTFHIDSIKTIIASAFELTAAMPNILEQCLYNIYIKAGWNLVTNRNMYDGMLPEEYLYPTFSDLTNEVADYLDHSDFGDETLGDYKGALLSRLKSFTNGAKGLLLNTAVHPDYENMISGRNIIELEGLADDADKCLVMGTIMVQYYQYLKYHQSSNSGGSRLKHIMVIEESHRLFKNVSKQNKSEGADPTGQLVESLSNILAEIRAFGEGVLIVDQSPTKIAEDVIKNSGTKIIHRIDNQKDIQILLSAMLLPDDETCFPSLAQGEAMIRSDGMLRPCKVKILRSTVKDDYSLSTSFRIGAKVDIDLQNMFAVSAIMQNDRINAELHKVCERFINSLAFIDWTDWYELIDNFLIEVMLLLQKRHMSDMLGGQLSALFLLISSSIKQMYSDGNKLQMGYIHMFVMRVLDMYRDERDGKKVKALAIGLLDKYEKQYLTAEIIYMGYDDITEDYSYVSFSDATNMEYEPRKRVLYYRFAKLLAEIQPDIQEQNHDSIKRNMATELIRRYTLLDEEKYSKKIEADFDQIAMLLNDDTKRNGIFADE